MLSLNHFDLHLQSTESVGLLGVNGAGKSTAIKSILGLIHTNHGTVDLPNSHIGYMPEIAHMPESITPLSFVRFALRIRQQPTVGAEAALKEIGLDASAWKKPIHQLSKGMRQRAGLAFALAGSPQWIVLDEPMTGLDAVGRLAFMNILKQRQQAGAAMLICSHIVPDLVRLSQRIIIMGHGRVLEEVVLSQRDMHEIESIEGKLRQWSTVA